MQQAIRQVIYGHMIWNQGLKKKIADAAWLDTDAPRASWIGRFFNNLQLWPQIFLQTLDLQGSTVPRLKDLILSVWGQKSKAVVWILRYLIMAQNTPISNYTGANGCIFYTAGVLSKNLAIKITYLEKFKILDCSDICRQYLVWSGVLFSSFGPGKIVLKKFCR